MGLDMDFTDLEKALSDAGFAADAEAKTSLETFAENNNLHDGGPYVVHELFRKGATSVLIEQTTTTDVTNGLNTQTTHPPVAIVAGPGGRVACSPDDVELVLTLINDVG